MKDQENQVPLKRDNIHHILKGADDRIRSLLLTAHGQQFTVAPTSGGHYKVSTPEGARPMLTAFTPKTPSDARGIHRVRAKLRRIGVKFSR